MLSTRIQVSRQISFSFAHLALQALDHGLQREDFSQIALAENTGAETSSSAVVTSLSTAPPVLPND